MDQSLDQIIANKPKPARRGAPRRRAAPSARAEVLGKPATAPASKTRAAVAAVQAAKVVAPVPAEKIVVSGLPLDVNEQQVKDLFAQTIGPVKEVTLSYNAQGKSKGIATVLFSRKGDGSKAYQQYNNRLIDGSKPMKIEIIVDPIRSVPLAARVAPPAAAKEPAATRGAGPVRRGRGGGRAPRARAPKPAPKTAADLDAEMEDYTAAASNPAAAAAAPAS